MSVNVSISTIRSVSARLDEQANVVSHNAEAYLKKYEEVAYKFSGARNDRLRCIDAIKEQIAYARETIETNNANKEVLEKMLVELSDLQYKLERLRDETQSNLNYLRGNFPSEPSADDGVSRDNHESEVEAHNKAINDTYNDLQSQTKELYHTQDKIVKVQSLISQVEHNNYELEDICCERESAIDAVYASIRRLDETETRLNDSLECLKSAMDDTQDELYALAELCAKARKCLNDAIDCFDMANLDVSDGDNITVESPTKMRESCEKIMRKIDEAKDNYERVKSEAIKSGRFLQDNVMEKGAEMTYRILDDCERCVTSLESISDLIRQASKRLSDYELLIIE